MEEWLDVYVVSGKMTGKTVLRGSSLQEGEYVLCTHVILRNSDGRFLIQQRSAIKATRPGVWDITAGAVDAGENSLDGALRAGGNRASAVTGKDAVLIPRPTETYIP